MKNSALPHTLVTLLIALGMGCSFVGTCDQKEDAIEQPKNLEEAMKQMGDVLTGGEDVEPVDFRDLKELLPEKLPGMHRVDASGEKVNTFGVKVSQAEGKYESEDDSYKNINISIVDMGSMKGASMLGYAWLSMDFDRETENGYERTTTYKGFPAYEKLERHENYLDCEMTVVVAKRFVVNANGDNVDMDKIKSALKQIDFNELEDMKSVGVK